MNLTTIRELIQQNRLVIIENLNKQIAAENVKRAKIARMPELKLEGNGYLSNSIPLAKNYENSNSLLYQFTVSTDIDLYTGGMHSWAIKRMKTEQKISEDKFKAIEEEIELQAYIMLYDMYRNMKYLDFIRSSIHLREMEYERIDQLFKNGLVLKSDLLRSKLYITDLQKDEVAIENSISILSENLCTLLGMADQASILPDLEKDLDYQVSESFDNLFNYALVHSPHLNIYRSSHEREEIALKEIRSNQIPHLKLYANYGVGSAQPIASYDHRLGGEIGLKLSMSLSALYKTKHQQNAQKQRIQQSSITLNDEQEKLRNTIYELYTRYNESLLNIQRAIEKIAMSKESARILRNSYFNQQALLIDVLESETKSMEASFEWVEAIVDSQKYFWALKQICGYL